MTKKSISPAKKSAEKRNVLAKKLEPAAKLLSAGKPRLATDARTYLRRYGSEKPEVIALWCLGVGFVLGWKLKFW